MKHARKLYLALGVLVAMAVPSTMLAQAETGPDLSPVTDGVDGVKTAVLGVAATVIGAGLALMAVKFGGKWVVRLFKSFSS